MKKTQLLEWGIIVIALIFGYKFFEGIISLFLQLIYAIGFENNPVSSSLLGIVLATIIYVVGFILMIRNSHRIAVYLDRSGSDEAISIKIGKRSLLQVILIGICIAAVLSNAGDVLVYLFESFKDGAGGNDPFEEKRYSISGFEFRNAAVETILALVVLFYSKGISQWFIQKNLVDELVFESETEK